ncbi:MAG: homocysteine S-methyltransferase family protein [bacterium]
MHPTIKSLLEQSPIITDGAWGTQLQQRGLKPGECPDLWNLTKPEAIEAVARSYVKAGSRIILSNTFGANRIMLASHGAEAKTGEINRAGASLSRKAAGSETLVFTSMGPTGKLLMTEEITEEEMSAAFNEQAQALAEGGAQGIVVETMSDLQEAVIAARAAKSTGLPVIVSMVFDSGLHHDRTMMGNSPEEVVEQLEAIDVDALGANCGMGVEHFLSICKSLRSLTALPIWIKPNAGMPEIVNGKIAYRALPEQFSSYTKEIVAAGANFIGGCCGTNANFITKLAETFSTRR